MYVCVCVHDISSVVTYYIYIYMLRRDNYASRIIFYMMDIFRFFGVHRYYSYGLLIFLGLGVFIVREGEKVERERGGGE
jgi:hypothetical protein